MVREISFRMVSFVLSDTHVIISETGDFGGMDGQLVLSDDLSNIFKIREIIYSLYVKILFCQNFYEIKKALI